MAIAMKAGGYGGGGAGSGGGINETLPPMVTNLKAKVNNQIITLSWTNPKSEHLAGVLVTCSTTKMPENPMDGETVDAKLAETITLTGLTNDIKHYIRVFPYNKEEQYQTLLDGATITAVPVAITKVLNDNSWETISSIAKDGEGANYWKVGDAKETEITGSVDGYDFTGKHYPFIIGFNHNEAVEGKGIHFSFGKSQLTGGKDIAYQGFKMNDSNTNVGGYAGSKMFKTCESFFEIIAPDLKAVITPCNKWTDNKGGGNDNAGNVSATPANVWLTAEFEVFGKRTYANSTEQKYQKQYQYYADGNSAIRYNATSTGSAAYVWLRSSCSHAADLFCAIYAAGGIGGYKSSDIYAFAPCFKLGNTSISPVLNDSDWDVISEVAKAGTGANYWKVGDAKEVQLTGEVDGYQFEGSYFPFILGFDHNEAVEGKGIHFSFGKSALKYGNDVAYHKLKMSLSNANNGGWNNSLMRTEVCKNFYNIIPETLRRNIVACNKYTDNQGGATNSAGNITLTQDKIFILSEFEVYGSCVNSNKAEQKHQGQYQYYESGKSKVRYNAQEINSAVDVWLRSPYYGSATGFCFVQLNGNTGFSTNSFEAAFTPCFKLGSDAISPTLNSNSWEIISAVAKEGNGASYWKIGDCKEVPISGSASGYGFSGNYYPFIIGFNHNEQLEGKGIDFQFGKTALSGGKDVAFNGFKMNNSNVNNGGWNNCLMRTQTCSQFYNILPADLKAVIAPRTKYTDNVGGGVAHGNITATQDRIFILAEFETFGAVSYANSAEKNKQKQYEYYRLGNNKIRYDAKANGNAVAVWLRSPDSSGAIGFCNVDADGGAAYYHASYAFAFAPAFKL